MVMCSHKWVGLAAVVVTTLVQAPAWADEPVTANSVQLGAGFRYGIEMNEGDFNPFGVGLGLSGGYTMPNAVYLGGNFDYFFGDSVEGGGSKVSGNVWQLMAEGGYDIGLGSNFVIRPKLGAGLGTIRAEVCLDGFGCNSDSSTKFALAPGATFVFLTQHFGLSLDLRYAMIFADDTAKALIFSAGIGF